MQRISRITRLDPLLLVGAGILLTVGAVIIRSIAPSLFALHLAYIILSIIFFFLFLTIEFDILVLFSRHLYILSIFLLILPLVIGQVTRGAIRWIPIGPLTIQPSEIVRPILLLFFASYLTSENLDVKRLVRSFVLIFIPFALIVIQPALGVAILTVVGFFGVLLASSANKKYIAAFALAALVIIPFFWSLLAPYQKQRITSFLDPYSDPRGGGYNSIQSMISVGSGKIFGRGLGKGVQTQLAFLPEKHTDFIFAAAAEELGFVGAGFLLLGLFIVLWRLLKIVENPRGPTARAYVAGLFLTLFVETAVHIGMNVGLLPITGVPLPLVSAGGSALLATMMALAIGVNAKREIST